MNRNTIPYLILTVLVLLTGCQAHSTVDEIKPASSTTISDKIATATLANTPIPESDMVRLAWFYKPPEDGSPLSVLNDYFDVFILTHYDEDERDELKSMGADSPFLQYLLFVQIQDPGSCTEEPYGNQVAYKTNDFCTLQSEHPDWFLRDKNGEIIRNGRNAFMDPGNTEYREFWLERAKEMQEEFGWDGVFIDNVEASMNKFRRLESLPANYPGDDRYQVQIENFLAYVRNQHFGPNDRPMYANIIEYSDPAVWLRYMQYLDGVMVEDFAVDYNERYYSASEWENQLKMIEEAQVMGKSIILVSQGPMNDTERERFAFSSYLLINNGLSSFRYTDSDHYEEVWLYENYLVQLGSAKDTMYQENGGWRRDFANGYVFVNPSLKTSEIHINK